MIFGKNSVKVNACFRNYDGRELHVEYWTCSDRALLTGQSTPSSISAATAYTYQEQYPVGQNSSSFKNCGTPNSAGSKFSMKASVRTLSVAREPTTNLLCILFVKDKKKDKVLQKLGRKNKQRSSNDFANSHSRIVSSVSRMVCSSGSSNSNKNQCFLDVLIDGNRWKRIRFFQISHQWQTHVKLFPISFPLVSGLTNLNK
uniref:Phosphofurin acidic cluster sorting protein 1/2 C-terminal domain-containing protein n=1 Tax=Ditylenchus dipsaci TaxID=166011 RepID=A0A915D6B1_9BILA